LIPSVAKSKQRTLTPSALTVDTYVLSRAQIYGQRYYGLRVAIERRGEPTPASSRAPVASPMVAASENLSWGLRITLLVFGDIPTQVTTAIIHGDLPM
jgi:hypothetical protein